MTAHSIGPYREWSAAQERAMFLHHDQHIRNILIVRRADGWHISYSLI